MEPQNGNPFDSWESGRLVADRYRVKECVRQSGTAHLYRVEDVYRNTLHFLLRPSPRLTAKAGWSEWFQDYCTTAMSVPAHPNLLAAERLSNDGDMPLLLMQHVEGRGWDAMIADGSLKSLDRMLKTALDAAEGLAWLHQTGFVHGNIKPASVLVCDDGARIWKYPERESKTRAYASPEQLAESQALSPATDVWSWAVSVLEMFVGRVAWPTGADAPLALRRYMRNGPARHGLPLMPGALAELMAYCFHVDPEQRLTMSAAAEKLTGAREDAINAGQGAKGLSSWELILAQSAPHASSVDLSAEPQPTASAARWRSFEDRKKARRAGARFRFA